MRRTGLTAVCILCLSLLSCRETAQIEGFDSAQWKSDRNACQGERKNMQFDFDNIRRQLYGMPEQDIVDILGKPDSEQLLARGQRQFLYYLESGSQCEQAGKLSEANRAEVRFNALNKVSEITYTRPLTTP